MAYSEEDIAFARRAWKLKEDSDGNQVGALAVSIGEGLSKLPPGTPFIDDPGYLMHVIHAEVNAIKNRETRGCTLYTTRFPCKDCADLIKMKDIKRVVYTEECINNSGHEILEATSVECIKIPKDALGF